MCVYNKFPMHEIIYCMNIQCFKPRQFHKSPMCACTLTKLLPELSQCDMCQTLLCVCVCFWLVCQTWVHLSRMVNAAAVVELLWLSGSGKCAIAGAGWLTTQSWYRSIPLEGITCLVSKMTFSHRVRSKQPDYSPRLCSVGGIDDFCRI